MTDKLYPIREYKATVFAALFDSRPELLSLYNAVNGSHYDDPEKLTINTMEHAIYMGYQNDVSFLLNSELNLYEHQSTHNPNMPLRNLIYMSRQLERLIAGHSLYSSIPIRLPMPHFVVFYNGEKQMPERWEMRLSDVYKKKEGDPELELKVQVFNVNPGFNDGLKEACHALDGYCRYVERVRRYGKELPVEEAVDRAVAECIKEGILEKFLRDQKAQVVAMSIFEWNQEEEMRKLREAEFEHGRSVGESAGMEKGLVQGQALGELSGRAAFIVELLEETGPVPEWLRARINREKDREILSQWHRAAAKAGTVEEFARQTGLEQEFADKHGNEKDYING